MELAVSSHHRRVGDTIIAAYFLGKGKKWSVRREAGKKEFYWNHQVGGFVVETKVSSDCVENSIWKKCC